MLLVPTTKTEGRIDSRPAYRGDDASAPVGQQRLLVAKTTFLPLDRRCLRPVTLRFAQAGGGETKTQTEIPTELPTETYAVHC